MANKHGGCWLVWLYWLFFVIQDFYGIICTLHMTQMRSRASKGSNRAQSAQLNKGNLPFPLPSSTLHRHISHMF